METGNKGNRFIIQFIFLLFTLFFFSACSGLVSGYVYEKSESKQYVYISLESTDSRTVSAGNVDFTDPTKDFYFYIWGKSSSTTITPRSVNFNFLTGNSGTIELDFPEDTYYFVLAVTQTAPTDISSSNTILNNAILAGYSNADLKHTKTVKFYLSDLSLSGFGGVYLDFYLDSSWSNDDVTKLNADYTAKLGFYDDSGNMWTGYQLINLSGLNKTTPVSTENHFSNVPSGTYDMVVLIEKKNTTLKYIYTDKIIISPNRNINSTVYIPNVIENIPAAPLSFKASWSMDKRFYSIYDSSTETSETIPDDESIDNYDFDGYGVLFTWADNSKNETGFKITLADISKMGSSQLTASEIIASVPAVITDSYWNSLVNDYIGNTSVIKEVTAGNCKVSPEYISGSLDKNSTGLVLYLPFGSCYIAKIEAESAAGTSSACYVTLDEGFNISMYTGKPFAGNVINCYKTIYHLSGGTLSYTENYNPKRITGRIIKYHNYGEGDFLCPIASNTASGTLETPALICNSENWRRWVVGSYYGENLVDIIGGTSITVNPAYTYQKPNDYTGYTSLYLFARYD